MARDPAGDATRRLLLDGAGRVLARFQEDFRNGTVHADLFAPEPGVPVGEVIPVLLRELPGWRVSGRPEVGRALVAAGGAVHRHCHVLRRELDGPPARAPAPPGLRITPVDRTAADIAPAMMAAYPPGHPDHEPGDAEPAFVRARVERLLEGDEMGPLLACSRLAVAPDGTVVGGALACDMPGADPPFGGPWLGELFRDPRHRGAGRALLAHVLGAAAAAGIEAIGLTVTEGNPAQALYEAAGFALVQTFLNVDVPVGA